ncbi:MAG: hypothetical protein K8H88_04195 [Sandaracinaceae bacterium]|nr:hypothetical protein [Sandaracinaceae bacterium]
MRSELRDAAKALKPVLVQEYLRSRGWKVLEDLSERTGIVVYERGGFEAEVPKRSDYADFARRMTEALEVIADSEKTSVLALVDDLGQPAGDGLAIRLAEGRAASGTLPLADSLRVREATKNMLLAAAHSALSPQAFFPRMSKADAVDLVASVREAPPLRGSFVSRFIVPTEPAIGEQMQLEEPFGRRVVRLLMHALDEVHKVRALGAYEELLSKEKLGVSANLLSALAAFEPALGGGTLDISVSWSRNRPAPKDAVSRACFPEESLSGLQAVAETMRARATTKGFEVTGYVTRLDRPPSTDADGDVVIVPTEASAELQRVHVHLDAASYQDAIAAHREGREVRVLGTLGKTGRRWTLSDASGFEILTGPSEDTAPS